MSQKNKIFIIVSSFLIVILCTGVYFLYKNNTSLPTNTGTEAVNVNDLSNSVESSSNNTLTKPMTTNSERKADELKKIDSFYTNYQNSNDTNTWAKDTTGLNTDIVSFSDIISSQNGENLNNTFTFFNKNRYDLFSCPNKEGIGIYMDPNALDSNAYKNPDIFFSNANTSLKNWENYMLKDIGSIIFKNQNPTNKDLQQVLIFSSKTLDGTPVRTANVTINNQSLKIIYGIEAGSLVVTPSENCFGQISTDLLPGDGS